MADLNPDLKAEVITASEQQKNVVAEVLSQAFEANFVAESGEDLDIVGQDLPGPLSGSGLVLIPRVGSSACLILLPDVEGIVPEWCRDPDEAQRAVLHHLALELGKTLFPKSCAPTDAILGHVEHLAAALQRGGIDATAVCVSIALKTDTSTGDLYLVWPSNRPEDAINATAASSSTPANSGDSAGSDVSDGVPPHPSGAENPSSEPVFYRDMDEGISLLPPYARSLLKVKVPVTVTLASTKQPVNRILDLCPGSIIQFNKPCDDTLDLEVGGKRVAIGEAVKVGDKFGLWITAMAMPEERFWVVSSQDEPLRAK